MSKSYVKKIILFIAVFSITVRVSSAQFVIEAPATDALLGSLLGESSALLGATTGDIAKDASFDAADAALYAFAQMASRQLISMTLAAINGGASGIDRPQQFVGNFAQAFENLAYQEATIASNKLLESGDNPFAVGVGILLINSTTRTGASLLRSNINNIPGVDMGNATRDLSTAGIRGIDFYSRLGEPRNTPLGTAIISRELLSQNIENANNLKRQELTSSGFTPSKRACDVNYKSPSIYDGLANLFKDDPSKLLKVDGAINAKESPDDLTPNKISEKVAIAKNLPYLSPAEKKQVVTIINAQSAANYEYATGCANAIIENPVAAVQSLANQGLAAGFTEKQLADKWYKLLVNSMSQLVTGLIDIGISKLPDDIEAFVQGNGNIPGQPSI